MSENEPRVDSPEAAHPDDGIEESPQSGPHWFETAGDRRGGLRAVAWAVVGLVLGAFLFLDPLGVHPLDGWLQGALGLQRASGAGAAVGASGEARGEPVFYRNPMDPTITSPAPMKDDMGMDYLPVYADEAGEAEAQEGTVVIDPIVVQNMNVVTAVVERRDVERAIRTVGYLDYDQQRMVTVTTKYRGFVEKVHVNYVGEPVRAGQPLFEVYSPELVQTQEELLSALSFAKRLEGSSEESRGRARALTQAARQRLSYWDIGAEQIARLEETGRALRTLTVTAPKGGLVMKRMPGLEGMAINPGMELFHIADLSVLWLSVEVFEDQLPWLREGSSAEITLPYFPGEEFRGRVRFVEPQVNEKTRTIGLRLEVPNPDGRLRAGMYATVRFAPVIARDVVSVPAQAVIRTGERNVVIVALGQGRFAPREVTLGAEGNQTVAVLAGLEAGELVVTSSQFLLDSESNLRSAILKLLRPEEAHEDHSAMEGSVDGGGGEAAEADEGGGADPSQMDRPIEEPPRKRETAVDHDAMGHGERAPEKEPPGGSDSGESPAPNGEGGA